MNLNDLSKDLKNENMYYNLSWLLVEFVKFDVPENLNEGLKNMVGSMFYKNGASKKIEVTKTQKTDDSQDAEHNIAKPFAGLCKSGKTLLIPENPLFRTNDTELIRAAAQMFRGKWVDNAEAQKCLAYIISFLLKKFISKLDNTSSIDMDIIGDALIAGHLTYAKSSKDYALVSRVYDRITYHKDQMVDDLFKNPKDFKEEWENIKHKLATAIENILKTGGDMSLMLGQGLAQHQDTEKNKKK